MIVFEIITSKGPIDLYEHIVQTTVRKWPAYALPPLTLRGITENRDFTVTITIESTLATYDGEGGILASGKVVGEKGKVLCVFAGIILNPPILARGSPLPPIAAETKSRILGAN